MKDVGVVDRVTYALDCILNVGSDNRIIGWPCQERKVVYELHTYVDEFMSYVDNLVRRDLI